MAITAMCSIKSNPRAARNDGFKFGATFSQENSYQVRLPVTILFQIREGSTSPMDEFLVETEDKHQFVAFRNWLSDMKLDSNSTNSGGASSGIQMWDYNNAYKKHDVVMIHERTRNLALLFYTTEDRPARTANPLYSMGSIETHFDYETGPHINKDKWTAVNMISSLDGINIYSSNRPLADQTRLEFVQYQTTELGFDITLFMTIKPSENENPLLSGLNPLEAVLQHPSLCIFYTIPTQHATDYEERLQEPGNTSPEWSFNSWLNKIFNWDDSLFHYAAKLNLAAFYQRYVWIAPDPTLLADKFYEMPEEAIYPSAPMWLLVGPPPMDNSGGGDTGGEPTTPAPAEPGVLFLKEWHDGFNIGPASEGNPNHNGKHLIFTPNILNDWSINVQALSSFGSNDYAWSFQSLDDSPKTFWFDYGNEPAENIIQIDNTLTLQGVGSTATLCITGGKFYLSIDNR